MLNLVINFSQSNGINKMFEDQINLKTSYFSKVSICKYFQNISEATWFRIVQLS